MSRPFFTVICPCYNTKPENIRLILQSIANQEDIFRSEIEVIISDDCSTDDSYLKVVKKFTRILDIKVVKTEPDAMHCPGNNRANGVKYATGEWIAFIDHDDLFTPGCFKSIKNAIMESGEKYIAATQFASTDPVNYNNIIECFKYRLSWLHGKFYNLDNFWKARNIHFIKDLYTHEDMAIASQVDCELHKLGRPSPLYVEMIGYLWRAFPDSLSRQEGYGFLNVNFNDYVYATGELYIKDYKSNETKDSEETIEYYFKNCIDVILHIYFYMQFFLFADPYGDHDKNMEISKKFIKDTLETFNKTIDDIYNISAENNAYLYNRNRSECEFSIGGLIECESFLSFLYRATIIDTPEE